MTLRPYLTITELVTLMQRNRTTVWRWLTKKGIKSDNGRVSLLALKERWPEFYEGLALRHSRIPCPECDSPTEIVCTVCECRVA